MANQAFLNAVKKSKGAFQDTAKRVKSGELKSKKEISEGTYRADLVSATPEVYK